MNHSGLPAHCAKAFAGAFELVNHVNTPKPERPDHYPPPIGWKSSCTGSWTICEEWLSSNHLEWLSKAGRTLAVGRTKNGIDWQATIIETGEIFKGKWRYVRAMVSRYAS